MLFIFIGSTDLLSADHTSRFIGPFLRWFAPNVSDTTVAAVQFVVRKCGHLTEYAILAALLSRAVAQHRRHALGIAFILAAIYAELDEFHQSFVGSRTASPWDVAIDCLGAFIGLTIYRLAKSKSANHRSKIQ